MKRSDIVTWALGLGVSLAAGVVAWRMTKPPTPPVLILSRSAEPPRGERFDAAAAVYGPTLRASSMLRSAGHLVAYAVDRVEQPSMEAKWASDPNDPAPFIEVQLREPVEVESVVLALSGSRSGDSASNKTLEVRCLLAGKLVKSVPFHRNTAPRITAPMQGATCDAVGAWFTLGSDDIARLYEIEAWGILR